MNLLSQGVLRHGSISFEASICVPNCMLRLSRSGSRRAAGKNSVKDAMSLGLDCMDLAYIWLSASPVVDGQPPNVKAGRIEYRYLVCSCSRSIAIVKLSTLKTDESTAMAPALGTNSTASSFNATAASQSAAAHLSPLTALVLTVMLAVLATIVCSVALVRVLIQCLALKKQLAKRKKKQQAIRPFVLRSGSSKVELVAGSQGPKPLLLPTMNTVRSSRGKASLASRFLPKWGATNVERISKADVEHAPSPTLVGSDFEDKPKDLLSPEWTPRLLYCSFPIARDVHPSATIVSLPAPVATAESKPLVAMFSEDLSAPTLESIPEAGLTVDIVEVSPSVSGSAFASLLVAADVNAPGDPAAVPTIVVHDCSRPGSAAMHFDEADDRLSLRVPSFSWLPYLDDEEPEEATAHEGS
ncbi:uncharacterized protein C8Q71DRAFT_105738 [Rhodofomes roseus]|uniref:Transmembrane protein n=1 Tax=Rhodofomes roseus TaxID=34475 RepID=A0ABQ8KC10_9APHY|nr:uncharacterized protein C8Q71DRAFT_105738 [Rhodofomes roseus]KAH9835140.1 hypothetical protein C8Q71DRAFT_105738 [Rhodofomes roseus]